MRAPLLLIALALTACGKAPTDFVDSDRYRTAEAAEYAQMVHAGTPPAKAKAQLASARDLSRKLEHDPEMTYREQQQQKEVQALHVVTCRNQPYLESCR